MKNEKNGQASGLKGAVFGVLFILLKESGFPYWVHIFTYSIDFIQIISFSFAINAAFPWHSEKIVQFCSNILQVFRMETWLGKMALDIYIVVFYLSIFLALLVVVDFVYAFVSFSKKSFACIWPLKVLRNVSGLFVTILFLPLFGIHVI